MNLLNSASSDPNVFIMNNSVLTGQFDQNLQGLVGQAILPASVSGRCWVGHGPVTTLIYILLLCSTFSGRFYAVLFYTVTFLLFFWSVTFAFEAHSTLVSCFLFLAVLGNGSKAFALISQGLFFF